MSGRDDGGPAAYVIRTKRGWRALLPPMAPAPAIKTWWRFPMSQGFDRLFDDGEGGDMRVNGNWYHLRTESPST